jgi:LacI family transcriptional regulator
MSSDERATLQTIAREVGCSVMTVSRALRSHPYVRLELRDRIIKTARELDYHPDPVLSSLNAYRTRRLRKRESDVIIFLTNWKTEFGWQRIVHLSRLFAGIRRRALELGFKIEPFWLRAPGLTKRRASEILHARGIRGIVVAPLQPNIGHITFDWANFSAVSIGYSVVSPRSHFVSSDYFQGLVLAWRKLRQLGYERIGLAIGRRHDVRTVFRWNSAFLGLQAQIPRSQQVRSMTEGHVESTQEKELPQSLEIRSFQKWFRKEKPDAVLSLGPGIPGWIAELGYRVPEDVGYANLDLHDPDGKFAGVYQHPDLIGATSIDLLQMLLQRFEQGLPSLPQSLIVNASWVDGATASQRPTARLAGARRKR